jgi:hypothetical protein
MPFQILRAAIYLQAGFYLITALWSFLNLDTFLRATGYEADPFKTHSNAVLFAVIGGFMLFASFRNEWLWPVAGVGFSAALGLAIVEFYYLPRIGNPLGFWFDFVVEGVFVLVYIFEWLMNRARPT